MCACVWYIRGLLARYERSSTTAASVLYDRDGKTCRVRSDGLCKQRKLMHTAQARVFHNIPISIETASSYLRTICRSHQNNTTSSQSHLCKVRLCLLD